MLNDDPEMESGVSTLFSDDFDQSTLDTGLWTIVDPLGDGTVAVAGGKALLSVPAGVNHDPWTTNESVRIMQAANDVDFEMEVSQAEEDTKTNEAEAGLDAAQVAAVERVVAEFEDDACATRRRLISAPGACERVAVRKAVDERVADRVLFGGLPARRCRG